MKADASSAMFIVLDAHNRTMAKNYVQGTLLDRFVECILSARKCGLAVRQAMQQAMQKCDDMYSRLPTVLTDDRFGSGVGVCAVCLNMGTLTTANLGACRAVLLLTSQMLSGQLAGHASWPHIYRESIIYIHSDQVQF